MIESFFVWLLGPHLAPMLLIFTVIGVVLSIIGIAVNFEDILKWWEARNARK